LVAVDDGGQRYLAALLFRSADACPTLTDPIDARSSP
jgi:hypothetical protein